MVLILQFRLHPAPGGFTADLLGDQLGPSGISLTPPIIRALLAGG